MGIAERREREKQLRRSAIQDAARKVFAAKGFAGATMEQIAEAAELSPATLYNYFKNKNELFAGLNVRVLEYVTDSIDELKLRRDLSPPEKVRALAETLMDGYSFDPMALNNLVRVQVAEFQKELSEEMMDELNALASKGIRSIAELIDEGIESGHFNNHHSVAMADFLWGSFTGLMIWEESKRHINSKKDFFQSTLYMAFNIMVDGITKEPASE